MSQLHCHYRILKLKTPYSRKFRTFDAVEHRGWVCRFWIARFFLNFDHKCRDITYVLRVSVAVLSSLLFKCFHVWFFDFCTFANHFKQTCDKMIESGLWNFAWIRAHWEKYSKFEKSGIIIQIQTNNRPLSTVICASAFPYSITRYFQIYQHHSVVASLPKYGNRIRLSSTRHTQRVSQSNTSNFKLIV